MKELERALAEDDIIVIDEIGKMELFSHKFQKTIKTILDSAKPVMATSMKSRNLFTDNIKMRSDVILFEVTECNRNSIKSEIINLINHQLVETK